ncbi:MAG: class I SAM-dependent methyltransferase [Actinomycetota bacterium]|nr:class I SAM-dependent methyltransferase [Actinomycetota bacterium]MDQ6945464.1 class I SAM-dependent methyltransferase [Actinomycetota bacterium]
MATNGDRLRDAIFLPENPRSLPGRARARRWRALLERFPDFADMRVLDLGGTPHSWASVPVHPAELTLINLGKYETNDRVRCILGDACDPPPELDELTFDFIYSNSVIEHVGGYHRRRAFADVVARTAPHYWIQTPARSFPIEPHWLFPGFQFLPVRVRALISQHWPFGFSGISGDDRDANLEEVLYVELLGAAEMGHLFPGSELLHERFVGLTKSLIAVR